MRSFIHFRMPEKYVAGNILPMPPVPIVCVFSYKALDETVMGVDVWGGSLLREHYEPIEDEL